MKHNEITHEVIGAAIEVHRELGPRKTEAAYEAALAHELGLRGLPHQAQKPIPVVYKGVKLDCGYRLDVLASNAVVIEVKAVEAVIPVHRAQVLTCLRLGGWQLALLINFNVATLKEGIQRLVLNLEEDHAPERVNAAFTPTENSQAYAPVPLLATHGSGDEEAERLAREVIAASVEVHRNLGPGLLSSSYTACLCHELHLRGVQFERKRPLALAYKGVRLAQEDAIELLVGGCLVVKPCTQDDLRAVDEAQLLSQLRIGGWCLGLLINFNTIRLADGIQRIVESRNRKRLLSQG